jgi:glycosyltransferase involved in cell wall biosynthesis
VNGPAWDNDLLNSTPSLDVIIPAANAAATVGDAIDSVKAQGYRGLQSIVVASADEDTTGVAREHGAQVVANAAGLTPVGLNLALATGKAEFVARVDAQSIIPPGYLERAVEILVETGADNVGGMQVPSAEGGWAKTIAAAMASPLGAGDARYRIGGVAGPAETVYLGVFRRQTLERLGGYDEDFKRNQDYELNHRIRESGGVVWFDPQLKVQYRPRSSLRALARQYFEYGRWKRFFSRRHPGSLRWRQAAPPLLVGILLVSLVGSIFAPVTLLIPAAYLLALIFGALLEIPDLGWPALGLPAAWAIMHVSWGVGFLVGE